MVTNPGCQGYPLPNFSSDTSRSILRRFGQPGNDDLSYVFNITQYYFFHNHHFFKKKTECTSTCETKNTTAHDTARINAKPLALCNKAQKGK